MTEVPARLNKGETRSWEKPVAALSLASGELLVTDSGKTTILKADKEYKPKTAALSVYAIDHSNFAVIFDA